MSAPQAPPAARRQAVLLAHLAPAAGAGAAAAAAPLQSAAVGGGAAAPVAYAAEGGVAVLRIAYAPVNSLHPDVLRALCAAYRRAVADAAVRAVVVTGSGANFVAGADIGFMKENGERSAGVFAEAAVEMQQLESGPKPVVAAVNGTALGGGLELAMLCSHRVVVPGAVLGLPELRLGLIPGLGGTQRLPRLVGLQKALEMMLQSKTLRGEEAVAAGLADKVATPETLLAEASALALAIADGRVARVNVLAKEDKLERAMADAVLQFARKAVARPPALRFPVLCIDAVEFGLKNGGSAGLVQEGKLFYECLRLPTASALMHVFFAQRATAKVPGVTDAADIKPRPLRRVGVLGGGLMGSGIATSLLQNGAEVWLKEVNEQFLQAGVQRVEANLKRFVKSGRMSEAQMGACMARLHPGTTYAGFRELDMVIEAVIEKVALKQQVFVELEEACGPQTVLATNTSTIDIDVVGAKTKAQERIVGVHFFSPAHIMPLLEIIRTSSVSKQVVADALGLAKLMRKTAIVVGNCVGFTVNRIFFPYGQAADMLVDHGASPYDVDKALMQFGMPMGVYRLNDMVGGDVVVFVGQNVAEAYGSRVYKSALRPALIEAQRFGEKTKRGFYVHADGKAQPDPELDAFVAKARAAAGRPAPVAMSAEEMVEVVLFPVVNEATRVLEEGHVIRPSDIDIATLMGYGFPAHLGGILHWADARYGTKYVCEKLQCFAKRFKQEAFFQPSALLARLAASNTPIGSLGGGGGAAAVGGGAAASRNLFLEGGKQHDNDDDVVVVRALRTALTKAKRGGFKDTRMEDMLRPVLEEVVKGSPKLSARDVEDITVGTVLPRGDGAIVAFRAAALLAGFPNEVPIKAVNRLCSSGLQAVADVATAIRSGLIECGIAAGVESMSSGAMGQDMSINELVIGTPIADVYLPMGLTSENVSTRFNVSREDQDRFAAESHRRAEAAIAEGRFKAEIVPVKTKVTDPKTNQTSEVLVQEDDGVRKGATAEALGKLQPAFRKDGKSTAGNSSQLTDGAAAVLLMTRRKARECGLRPLGVLRSYAAVGVEPGIMGVGPAYAIPRAVEMAGLSLGDIQLYEINEAFASQALYSVRKLGLDMSIVNVNGGAIALGHPLGCTGARQVATLLHEMRRRKARFGVVSMCIGTGMGAAAVFEAEH